MRSLLSCEALQEFRMLSPINRHELNSFANLTETVGNLLAISSKQYDFPHKSHAMATLVDACNRA